MKRLSTIFKQIGINPNYPWKKISGGKVNETFLITDPPQKYILQEIKVRKTEAADDRKNQLIANARTKNYLVTAQVMKEEGIACPTPLQLAAENSFVFLADDSSLWRIFEYLDHQQNISNTEEHIASAAKALGTFHKNFSASKFIPPYPIPDFHNTPFIVNQLREVSQKASDSSVAIVKEELKFLLNTSKQFFLPKDLAIQVIHGDPKLNNFLFNKNEQIIAIIDLDNLMLGPRLLDIGDALRSWCNIDNVFSYSLANIAIDSYTESYGLKQNDTNWMLFSIQATRLITLELAGRYLIDYFLEEYFSWDKEKYARASEHNLLRCKKMINYFHSI